MDGTGGTPPRAIAGFWRRLLAFFIDGMLVGAAGLLLGWAFFDAFARMGEAARLAGVALVWPYFGLLNSGLCGGQTVGKWLLGIRVVGRDGAPLDASDALLRALVLWLPFMASGVVFPASWWGLALAWASPLVVYGGPAALAYLYVFNRDTRQSLHDLAARSYVVRDESAPARLPTLGRPHLWIAGGVALVATGLPLAVGQVQQRPRIDQLLPALRAVGALPLVSSATVKRGYFRVVGGDRAEWVGANVRRTIPRVDDEEFARQVARILVEKYPESREVDTVSVRLLYGYDIGIASGWRAHTFNFPVQAGNDSPAAD